MKLKFVESEFLVPKRPKRLEHRLTGKGEDRDYESVGEDRAAATGLSLTVAGLISFIN